MKKIYCLVGRSNGDLPVRYEFDELEDATKMFVANVEKGNSVSVVCSEEKVIATFSPS